MFLWNGNLPLQQPFREVFMKHLGHIHDNYSTSDCQRSFILKLMSVKWIIKNIIQIFCYKWEFLAFIIQLKKNCLWSQGKLQTKGRFKKVAKNYSFK